MLTTKMALDSGRTIAKASRLLSLGSLAARERDLENRRAKLLKSLCPFQDRFDRRQRHERKKGPVGWIFENSHYVSWSKTRSKPAVLRPLCLILSGKIGSGKTVAAANIFSSLQASSSRTDAGPSCEVAAAFFCRAGDPGTLESHTIMGSIVYQFVRSLGNNAGDAVNKYLPSQST